MSFSRPSVGSVPLVALVTTYLLFVTNGTFRRKALTYLAGHPLDLAGPGLGLFLLLFAILTTFSLKYAVKPILIALILVSAIASYFVDSYGILIDREMISNVVLTGLAEANRLMTPGLFLHLALFGLLPSLRVALARVRHRTFWQKAKWNSAAILPSVAVATAVVLFFYPTFASTFRMHRDLIASLNPVAPLMAGVGYAKQEIGERSFAVAPLGTDAVLGPRIAAATRPVVTVLMVGETARSQQFGLDGYGRDTTPELARRDVISFTQVSSCGTSTAVSVPCMFSNLTRANYSRNGARSVENVLDILARAGFDVRWFDNDTGGYHVADRVPYTYLPATDDPRFCSDGECLDEILVDRLARELVSVRRNTVIVLHQLGSHGPTYFERYPKSPERFTPACGTAEFADCRRGEIVNAYDNTIRYTDHVLARTIDLLAARTDLETAMLYLSDHGESLGENGIYLHAMPYLLAPATQTTVPMIAWFSPAFAERMEIDRGCLRARRDASLSHDNLFHTLLGLGDVRTADYDARLDAFAPCRAASSPAHVSSLGGAAL